MGIGEHKAGPINHNPGSLPTLTLGPVPRLTEKIPQQRVNQIWIEGLALHHPLGVDAHNSRGDIAYGVGHKAVGARKTVHRREGQSGLSHDHQSSCEGPQPVEGPLQGHHARNHRT